MLGQRVMQQTLERHVNPESYCRKRSVYRQEFGSCDACSQSFGYDQTGGSKCRRSSTSTCRVPAPLIPRTTGFNVVCTALRSPVTHGPTIGSSSQSVGFAEFLKKESFVHWFREAWPYIQGHRSSVFVIVIPGDIIADGAKFDGILQDILLLHGLGVKLVVIPGTQPQIDQLLIERGLAPRYEGAYRITDTEALEASMEAAGRIRVTLEAKLSRGTTFPDLRRSGDSDRWNEVAVAGGNYLAAKRRGVVNGVDFGATGEVKRIDIQRIKQDLDKNSIVLVSNLGYSSTGEVLNCNMYEVATACAIALQAEKLLCLLDGPVLDDKGRPFRSMTLQEADKLIRDRASQSSAAADYVKAVAGPAYVKSLGLTTTTSGNGSSRNGALSTSENGLDETIDGAAFSSTNGSHRTLNGHPSSSNGFAKSESGLNGDSRTENGYASGLNGYAKSGNGSNGYSRTANGHASISNGNAKSGSGWNGHSSTVSSDATEEEKHRIGFAIGGFDRFSRTHGYLSEMTAAVYACRHGVGRVHLLDTNVNGALLLELYSRDGVGNMISSYSYEDTRAATSADIPRIHELLKPFIEEGILVRRHAEELKQKIHNYSVVERDGSIIACCSLVPYHEEKCGEVAAFAVSPECRGSGIGSSLLEYVEKLAGEMGLEKIFVLTTRTADWFVQRGFTECTVDRLPKSRQYKIDFARRSKYYEKYIDSERNQ
ncbi:hypothetical protein R1sor_019189 [Riccia sorocarpa]|uniref:amino-acid N-acetyltransferase n=1 Tax=Riccia sorocarpa TaxID=122646 RepID=A0ABD3IEJ1_9MARC